MKNFLILLLSLYAPSALAQWVAINPGAGGQVQDVVCDPKLEGVLYLASDMEGVYKSTDNGESWRITGRQLHNRTYAVAISPEDSERLYIGTLNGISSSSDGGKTYQFIDQSFGNTFAEIAVSPHNAQQVIAGVGWRDDYDFLKKIPAVKQGLPRILISEDGGQNWEWIVVDHVPVTDRNISRIFFHPQQESVVFLSTYSANYRSDDHGRSWYRLPGLNTEKQIRGLDISPDGRYLVTIFADQRKVGRPYWAAVDNVAWLPMGEIPEDKFWYPEFDQRVGEQYQLLLSLEGSRRGLYKGTFGAENSPSTTTYEIIWKGLSGFDTGWDYAEPNPRFAHFTPPSWSPAVWSTTNQTIFCAQQNNGQYQWENRYAIPNDQQMVKHAGKSFPTYRSRGTESTYTYDVAAHENYVIQGQGDNGMVESWDGGKHWSNMSHRTDSVNYSDVQAIALTHLNDVPTVLIQATAGYGGRAKDGRLLMKKLVHHSPEDQWQMLGGGPEHLLGLPDGVFRELTIDPTNPHRLYLHVYGHGVYMIDDLNEAIRNPKYQAVKISNGVMEQVVATKKMTIDPLKPNELYLTGTRGNEGLFRGVKQADQSWSWEKLFDGGGWDSEVFAWEHQGQSFIAYGGKDEHQNADYVFKISRDHGASWQEVFSKAQAQALSGERHSHWFKHAQGQFAFEFRGGLIAEKNTLYVNYFSHKFQNSYGIYRGTFNGEKWLWEDITADLHYPGITSAFIDRSGTVGKLLISTCGTGSWYLPLDQPK